MVKINAVLLKNNPLKNTMKKHYLLVMIFVSILGLQFSGCGPVGNSDIALYEIPSDINHEFINQCQVNSNDELGKIAQIYLPYCGCETAADNIYSGYEEILEEDILEVVENSDLGYMKQDNVKLNLEVEPEHTDSSNNDQYYSWTIEELGEIIAAGNAVWEDWWLVRGRFSMEHQGWHYNTTYQVDGGIKLLPTSGFVTFNDIRNYLLQFYTENWVNRQLSGQFTVFFEYNDMPFINYDAGSFGAAFTSFRTAEHILIEQNRNYAVVQTTALSGPWHKTYCCPWEDIEWLFEYKKYYFFFTDGRIDSIIVPNNTWNPFGQWQE